MSCRVKPETYVVKERIDARIEENQYKIIQNNIE